MKDSTLTGALKGLPTIAETIGKDRSERGRGVVVTNGSVRAAIFGYNPSEDLGFGFVIGAGSGFLGIS